MNLFDVNYIQDKLNFKAIPVSNNEVFPALDSYATTPDRVAAEHIAPLVESLLKALPKGVKEDSVTFCFMGTGTRTLPPTQAEAIYKNIKSYLKEHTSFKVKYVGTISGQMESLYDWISINCYKNKIDTSDTYGTIDMGGGSVQVAYAENVPTKDGVKIKIGNKTFDVYARSYMGLGRLRICAQYSGNPNCFPNGLELPDATGNGNYSKCLEDIKPMITSVHRVASIPKDIIANTEFIMTDNFYKTLDSKLFNLGSNVTVGNIRKKGEQISKLSWNEMIAQYPNDPSLYSYYAYSAFIVDFLNVLGFQENTNIIALNQIDGVEASFALGAAVYYASGN